ncbi:hypothetical protein [Clostridium perfringens]|nr:hypothetical protein [Clostridium perfringens]
MKSVNGLSEKIYRYAKNQSTIERMGVKQGFYCGDAVYLDLYKR